MALGEVLGHEPPTGRAEEERPADVEDHGGDPDDGLTGPADQSAGEQQRNADEGRAREPGDRAPQAGVVAARDQEEPDVRGAHGAVGDRELDRAIAERVGHRERRHEHRRHRREHRQPDRPVLGIDDARQPGVTGPGPPEDQQHQQSLAETGPAVLVDHQRRALSQREHEDEVEEQLERHHPLRLAPRRRQAMTARALGTRFHRAHDR